MTPAERDFSREMQEKYPCLFHEEEVWIEVLPGWFDLVDSTLEMLCQSNWYPGSEDCDLPEISQIKQKYGTLRIYMSGGNQIHDAIVDLAERDSASICELCGGEGQIKKVLSWVNTLCDECRRKECDG